MTTPGDNKREKRQLEGEETIRGRRDNKREKRQLERGGSWKIGERRREEESGGEYRG